MDSTDFYSDRKWCDHCEDYVAYLQSLEQSWCVQCGTKVRLFSESDWSEFHSALKDRKPKGGRPRKRQDKESA